MCIFVKVQCVFKISNVIHEPGYVSKWMGYTLGDRGICLRSNQRRKCLMIPF